MSLSGSQHSFEHILGQNCPTTALFLLWGFLNVAAKTYHADVLFLHFACERCRHW